MYFDRTAFMTRLWWWVSRLPTWFMTNWTARLFPDGEPDGDSPSDRILGAYRYCAPGLKNLWGPVPNLGWLLATWFSVAMTLLWILTASTAVLLWFIIESTLKLVLWVVLLPLTLVYSLLVDVRFRQSVRSE
jgi:hypothetical protein